jgi:hypothetical protein
MKTTLSICLPRLIASSILILAGIFSTGIVLADTLYIGDGGDNTVKRFDADTGAYLGTFVDSSSGLNGPRGLIFTQGNLSVSNQNVSANYAGEILQYNGNTGNFLGALVPCNPPLGRACDPNGPFAPQGIVMGLGHTLYVADQEVDTDGTTGPGKVSQFDVRTGNFLGNLDTTGFTAPFHPRSIVLGPDDLLYVSVAGNLNPGEPTTDRLSGYILRFNPHTGSFIDVFTSNSAAGCATHLHRPDGLVFGPDGKLYVTAFRTDASDTDKILIFDRTTGACLNQIVLGQIDPDDTLRAFAQAILFGPGGFLYVPITNTGAVRRYDVTKSSFPFTNLVPPGGPLESPWYLTFRNTNPKTLGYGD